MSTLKIPAPLRSYTNGSSEVNVQGATVREAMSHLIEQFPSLKPHLYNGDGELRPFVTLFIESDNVRDLQEMETPLESNALIRLIPSIAGG